MKKATEPPNVTIIINNFKDIEKELRPCLGSIYQTDYHHFEVIVADCKTKGLRQWLEANYPSAKLVVTEEDVGPSAQRNIGLLAVDSKAKYVLFMDNDIIVSKDWLTQLVAEMESHEEIGAIQPMMLKHSGVIDNAGCFIDPVGYVHRIDFKANEAGDIPSSTFRISYAETAVVLVRRSVLEQFSSEPFDRDYYIHYYDVDFCWRIWLLGKSVVLDPRSVVYHSRGVSGGLRRLPEKNIFINTRNRFVTLLKNYSLSNVVRYVPVAIFLETSKSLYLFTSRPRHATANIKAIFWLLPNLRSIWSKRLVVQASRKVTDKSFFRYFLDLNIKLLYGNFNRNYSNE